MADQKLTALTSLAALTTDDILYVVDAPAGAATSKKVAVSVLDARYLLEANNLSDLVNAGTARTNLGVAIGSDVQGYDLTLAAWAAYDTDGILTQTAANTFTGRTITGTANRVTVTNGDGVSGNPTLTAPQDIHTGASPTFVSVTLTGTIEIPTTTDTVGQIIQNSVRLIHTYGTTSIFIGNSAGNFTLTGARNIGVGQNSLEDLTSGNNNTSFGAYSLRNVQGGGNNVGLGAYAGSALTSGNNNVAVGQGALTACTTSSGNMAVGANALAACLNGAGNVGLGFNSLKGVTSGNANVGIGQSAGEKITTLGFNTLIGYTAGVVMTSAEKNTCIGGLAGNTITTGDLNIVIGYAINTSAVGASNELTIGGLIKGYLAAHGSGPAINFMGGTPQAQQAHIVDADGNLADVTAKFNTLLADLEGFGLLATA